MLYYNTVRPELLRILKELMYLPALEQLNLVDGTSLALQIGHRESVDIDLFGKIDFEYDNFSSDFSKIGPTATIKASKHINILTIDDIKVDFVNYRYPWIREIKEEEGLRLASIEDIAAMKLNAITGRGSKKDFIDLYFILQHFSFDELFQLYSEKYDDGNIFLVRKSLIYFEDAERQEMPIMHSNITWQEIKNDILKKFRKGGY